MQMLSLKTTTFTGIICNEFQKNTNNLSCGFPLKKN